MDIKYSLQEDIPCSSSQNKNNKNQKILIEHNIFFTGVSKLIKLVKNQREDELIQNEQTHAFITESTKVELEISRLEKYLSANKGEFTSTKFNLLKIYIHMIGRSLVKGLAASLALELMVVAGIYILDYTTDRLKQFTGDSQDKIILSSLFLSIVIIFTIRNVAFTQYEWMCLKWQAKCKTVLQYLVYQKSLKIKNFCKQNNQTPSDNQKDDDKDNNEEECVSFEKRNPDINNILTVDIEESIHMFWGINQTASGLVVLIVTLIFIYYKIGSSIVNGLYMLAGAITFNILLGFLINVNLIIYLLLFLSKNTISQSSLQFFN